MTVTPTPFVMWAALRKTVPNVLSRCHTKRRLSDNPSFGMTPTN